MLPLSWHWALSRDGLYWTLGLRRFGLRGKTHLKMAPSRSLCGNRTWGHLWGGFQSQGSPTTATAQLLHQSRLPMPLFSAELRCSLRWYTRGFEVRLSRPNQESMVHLITNMRIAQPFCRAERRAKTRSSVHPLDKIPKTLPALTDEPLSWQNPFRHLWEKWRHFFNSYYYFYCFFQCSFM